jgi:cysteine desulfurase/selenocysteine lyase
MEHHANVVPWHMLAAERGIELRWIPMTDDYRLDLSNLDELLDGARLLAITAMSNVLGTINEIRPLADAAHAHDALVLVDACQFVPHVATDVAAWDADFIAFSAHKMCGPSGIGALWARPALLEEMPPFLGGGEMIRDVRLDGFSDERRAVEVRRPAPSRSSEAVGFRCSSRLPVGARHGPRYAITRCD